MRNRSVAIIRTEGPGDLGSGSLGTIPSALGTALRPPRASSTTGQPYSGAAAPPRRVAPSMGNGCGLRCPGGHGVPKTVGPWAPAGSGPPRGPRSANESRDPRRDHSTGCCPRSSEFKPRHQRGNALKGPGPQGAAGWELLHAYAAMTAHAARAIWPDNGSAGPCISFRNS